MNWNWTWQEAEHKREATLYKSLLSRAISFVGIHQTNAHNSREHRRDDDVRLLQREKTTRVKEIFMSPLTGRDIHQSDWGVTAAYLSDGPWPRCFSPRKTEPRTWRGGLDAPAVDYWDVAVLLLQHFRAECGWTLYSQQLKAECIEERSSPLQSETL